MPTLPALTVFAYLVGSIPTGVWLARWKGLPDPRTAGSGNIGATNVARTLGKRMGVLTLIGDAIKGAIPVLVARACGLPLAQLSVVAAVAVLGHVGSIFLRFQGGKGVATGLGAFLALAPLAAGMAVVVFAVLFALTRLVSLSSIVAAATLPVVMGSVAELRPGALAAAVVAVVVIAKHRANIGRLLRAEEPRFGRGGNGAAA
ncbi:MAG: glycerol-3-phosphate 1-O-acyltransferase PlsY [Polyangiaceae bacterium]|jgi:glycerol-3-phosphate acyltransferase PlsY|nr:glycerol-3-phosphate 1-O-acyltransferase PlsY [Polyangiaceae bacterium]